MNKPTANLNINRTWSYFSLLLFPFLALIIAEPLPENLIWKHIPFHSFIESFGAAIALGTSSIILLFSGQGNISKIPLAIPLGLFAMGILDAFHSAVQIEHGFVWLHSTATFFGGMLFVNIRLIQKLEKNFSPQQMLVFLFFLFFSIGLFSSTFPENLPLMINDGQFSDIAIFLNMTGGLCFILAGLYLNHLYLQDQDISLKLLAILSILLGAAGVVFELSSIWDVTWWWWHILRLAAYSMALFYIFRELTASSKNILLNKERLDLATEAARIGIWDFDLERDKLIWDKQMFSIYHLKTEMFEGVYRAWIKALHPDDLEHAQDDLTRSLETGNNFISEFRIILPDKRIRYIKAHAQILHDKWGKPTRMVGTNWDITEQKELEKKIENLALTDALTGLPNRNLLTDRLELGIARCERTNEILTIALMDLDGFKPVNDQLGHDAGDQLLQEVAYRLKDIFRSEDTVLRLGGDEFVLIFGGTTSESDSELILQRVLNVIAHPFKIKNKTVKVTASIGATFYPKDHVQDENLIRHADQAMYKAKEQGKNSYCLFNPTFQQRHKENIKTIKRIEQAMLSGQLELYYQPQVNCVRGEVVGVEALIRWNHPILGLRLPKEFLPLIQKEDLIIDLGNWVIDTAVKQLDIWLQQGINISIGINIASRQLLTGNLHRKVTELRNSYSPDIMKHLEFELTESVALEDLKAMDSLIHEFQSEGVLFALDDFGTGFSSLSLLKSLSVDCLKIDKSFVKNMLVDPGDLAIIRGVMGLSKAFTNKVVAEGAESNEQIMALLASGCEIIQGFALTEPLPAKECTDWIRTFNMNPIWSTAWRSYPTQLDFELLVNEALHRNWLNNLRTRVFKTHSEKNSVTIESYDACKITKWADDNAQNFTGKRPDFNELLDLHRKLHELGDDIVNKRVNPDCESTIESDFRKVEEISKQLITLFRKLRQT